MIKMGTSNVFQQNPITTDGSSVIQRRGRTLANLAITNSKEMQELYTPNFISDLLEFVVTPKSVDGSTRSFTFTSCSHNKQGVENSPLIRTPSLNLVSPRLNSCALLTPLTLENTSIEDYLNDIMLENIEEKVHRIPNEFFTSIMNCAAPTKVTLFTPQNTNDLFSYNFFENANLNEGDITLLTPKTKEFITPLTPVVLKRRNEGRDQFNIYLPPDYTSDLVNYFQQYNPDSTMFPFPDTNFKNVINGNCVSITDDDDNTTNNNNNINNNNTNFDNIYWKHHCPEIDHTALSAEYSINSLPTKSTFNTNFPSTHEIYDGRVDCKVMRNWSSIPRSKCYKRKNQRHRHSKESFLMQGKNIKDFHNKLERERREEQFARFQKLKVCVPALMNKKKCSKISILKSATNYIKELHEKNRILGTTIAQEETRKNYLIQRLKSLSS